MGHLGRAGHSVTDYLSELDAGSIVEVAHEAARSHLHLHGQVEVVVEHPGDALVVVLLQVARPVVGVLEGRTGPVLEVPGQVTALGLPVTHREQLVTARQAAYPSSRASNFKC